MKLLITTRKLPTWSNFSHEIFLYDCGGEGDCMFHVISTALSISHKKKITMETVRNALAESIQISNLSGFITRIKNDQKLQLLQGAVDFNKEYKEITDLEETLQRIRILVRKSGTEFQGTDEVLAWLVLNEPFFMSSEIGFLLFSEHGPQFTNIIQRPSTKYYIMLFNIPNKHWLLATVKENSKQRIVLDKAAIEQMFSVNS